MITLCYGTSRKFSLSFSPGSHLNKQAYLFHFGEAAEARKADDLAHSYTVCALITLI